ncbi:Kelch repeat-containing protein [Granulosicoccus sp. 3-233]|uniref:Kelch repeat-containing protein n=1 Tax=Granulosicoccus sp. 3-233 TaxID=3417969 RepID=UPI003D358761
MQLLPASRLYLLLATALFGSGAIADTLANTSWKSITTSDDSFATKRHEAAAVAVDGKLYLMGGRGSRPIEVYDSSTKRWRVIGNPPEELHHFQPVVIGSKIYVIGAFTCCYPDEPSVQTIHVFDTATEQWSTAGKIPSNRLRGSAGAVVHDGEIYLVGGNTQGHDGGAVNWFDRYDPVSKDWDTLPNAPHARDHFMAVIVDGKLVAAAGRESDQPNTFDDAVRQTDVYDFSTNSWSTGANIPTVRAGVFAAPAGNEVLVAGGEIDTSGVALDVTEAYNVKTNSWRTLKSLLQARHSGGSATIGSQWHVVSGSVRKGGGNNNETVSHEVLELSVETDSDGDGLSDTDEEAIYNTDPTDPDSDDDGANDGDEVDAGSDPGDRDSDDDGLEDGAEIHDHLTSPILADTDEDGLSDGDEVLLWNTNPLLQDTDNDGLDDADEIDRGTLADVADTDADGLDDGAEIIAGTDPLNPDTDEDGLSDSEDPAPLVPRTVEPETTGGGETGGDSGADTGTDSGTGEGAGDGSDSGGSGVDSGNDSGSDSGSDGDESAARSGGGVVAGLPLLLLLLWLGRLIERQGCEGSGPSNYRRIKRRTAPIGKKR